MKECRCPACNSRMFDIECGRIQIFLSSEYEGEDEIRIKRLCKCRRLLTLVLSSTTK